MRRTCPYLLGALLTALVCLGGGLDHLDRLLAPVTAWIAAWLPAAEPGRLATPPPRIAIRELALPAAAACLALGPLLYRWSALWGLLAVAAWTGVVLIGVAMASHVGLGAAPPGPLLAAGLAAFATATLIRHVEAGDGSDPARSGR